MDTLFIPDLQPALKHPTVFRKFDALPAGESFLLINDHDPIPLFYELKAERGEAFEWFKVENGPDVWKVKIYKKPAAENLKETREEQRTAKEIFELNVTLLEPRQKHPTIFRHFDELKPGEEFQILNDHDPKPLYYQLVAERGNVFTWTYLEKGPQWWKVKIRKADIDGGETVGQIAAKDLRKAEVFKKYGIDFCCGGKKSLAQVCQEKGIEVDVVEAELNQVEQQAFPAATHDFNRWQPDFLADYIYNQHHIYYYEEQPVISDLFNKVVARHGAQHRDLVALQSLFNLLVKELNVHFQEEEKVVFPFIKALVKAKLSGNKNELAGMSFGDAVKMMESDHREAGEILDNLQHLSNNYTPPADACNSFQFLFKKLKALDEDLHQHIHLENNLLFPTALAIEKNLRD